MAANDDPEGRIREVKRPLADAARASEAGSSQPAGQGYPPTSPWTYGGPVSGPPQQRSPGNRTW